MPLLLRRILTPTAITRLLLGWTAVGVLQLCARVLAGPLPTTVLWVVLAAVVVVIAVCAFGVVVEAEHLARRLGDPYGTLVLTLSVVLIEVILICSVLLGPGEHATIARDSVMAVSMIILNLVVGLALVVGGLRHRSLHPNRSGVASYLAMLVVLLATAFAFPGLIGQGGSYRPVQAAAIIVMTIALYVFFLARQIGPQKTDFQEVGTGRTADGEVGGGSGEAVGIARLLSSHRAEILARTAVLVAVMTPIVLLSHSMAALLDDGLGRIGAPVALTGILIAMIVFLPETITTIRAARAGEIQRVSNLCHGALVSTVGLTIPAVLAIGMLTGRPVVLAESPVSLALLAVTLLLTAAGFSGRRVGAIQGAAHLMLFAVYAMAVFS